MTTPPNADEAGRSDREVLANIVHDDQREQCDLDPEGFYDCEQLADRILAAGFHRGDRSYENQLIEEMDRVCAERDALAAERDEALATSADWCKTAIGAQAGRDYAVARAENAEARLRKPTDGGTITAEDYWRERARAEAAEAKIAQAFDIQNRRVLRARDHYAAEYAKAEARATALEKALREIGRNARYSPGPSCMWCHRLLDDHDSDCPTNIALAALAGNGTGDGAT